MKKLTLSLFVLFFIVIANATNLTIEPAFFGANPATNRLVSYQMQTPFPGNLVFGTSDINGNLVFTNVPTNLLNCVIYAPPARIPFQVWITSTTLGTVDASNCLASGSSATFPAGQVAWAAFTSDLRYQLSGTTLSNTFYPLFSNPSNYVNTNVLITTSNGIVQLIESTNGYITLTQATNVANWVYSNNPSGYVTQTITNGLAPISFVQSTIASSNAPLATTNFVNSSVLGLATTGYVNTAIAPLTTTNQFTFGTNNIATNSAANLAASSNALSSVTAASSNAIIAVINIASNLLQQTKQQGSQTLTNLSNTGANTNQFAAGTSVVFTTNGSGNIITISVPNIPTTNGYASTNYVNALNTAATNFVVTYADTNGAALAAVATIAKGFQFGSQTLTNLSATGANTNQYVPGTAVVFTTNVSGTIVTVSVPNIPTTNGFVTASVTNGLVGPWITNGYATTNWVLTTIAASNAPYATIAQLALTNTANLIITTNLAIASTNGGNIVFTNNPIFTNVVTNPAQFVQSTNGTAIDLTVWTNLNFGNKTNWVSGGTNQIGLAGAGSTQVDGTYIVVAPNLWTNYERSGFTILLSGGNYYAQSNGISMYQSSNVLTWTTVNGVLNNPAGAFTPYWNMDGAFMRGTPHAPWLLGLIQTNGTSLTSSNATVAIVASLINGHTNYDLAVIGGGSGTNSGIAVTNGTGYGTTLNSAVQIGVTNGTVYNDLNFPVTAPNPSGQFSLVTGLPANAYIVVTGNGSFGSGSSPNAIYTNQNTLVGTSGGIVTGGWQFADNPAQTGGVQDYICLDTNTTTKGYLSLYTSAAIHVFISTNSINWTNNTATNAASVSGVATGTDTSTGIPTFTIYIPGQYTNQIYSDTNTGYLDVSSNLNALGNIAINNVPLTNIVTALINQYGVNPTNGITAANATNISAYQTLLGTNGLWSAINTVVSNTLYGQIVTATNGALIDTTNYVNIVSNSLAGQISAGGIPTLNGLGTNTTLKNAISIGVTNGTVYNVLSFPLVIPAASSAGWLTNGFATNAYFTVTGSGAVTTGGGSVNGVYTNNNTTSTGPSGFSGGFAGWLFSCNPSTGGSNMLMTIGTNGANIGVVDIYTTATNCLAGPSQPTWANGSSQMAINAGAGFSGTGTATATLTIPPILAVTNQIYTDTNTGNLDIGSNVTVLGSLNVSNNFTVNGQPYQSGSSAGSAIYNELFVTNGYGTATNYDGIYTNAGFGLFTNLTTGWVIAAPNMWYPTTSGQVGFGAYTMTTNINNFPQVPPYYASVTLFGTYQSGSGSLTSPTNTLPIVSPFGANIGGLFINGQNTTWTNVFGFNQVNITGTLTNNTTGNAATATIAAIANTTNALSFIATTGDSNPDDVNDFNGFYNEMQKNGFLTNGTIATAFGTRFNTSGTTNVASLFGGNFAITGPIVQNIDGIINGNSITGSVALPFSVSNYTVCVTYNLHDTNAAVLAAASSSGTPLFILKDSATASEDVLAANQFFWGYSYQENSGGSWNYNPIPATDIYTTDGQWPMNQQVTMTYVRSNGVNYAYGNTIPYYFNGTSVSSNCVLTTTMNTLIIGYDGQLHGSLTSQGNVELDSLIFIPFAVTNQNQANKLYKAASWLHKGHDFTEFVGDSRISHGQNTISGTVKSTDWPNSYFVNNQGHKWEQFSRGGSQSGYLLNNQLTGNAWPWSEITNLPVAKYTSLEVDTDLGFNDNYIGNVALATIESNLTNGLSIPKTFGAKIGFVGIWDLSTNNSATGYSYNMTYSNNFVLQNLWAGTNSFWDIYYPFNAFITQNELNTNNPYTTDGIHFGFNVDPDQTIPSRFANFWNTKGKPYFLTNGLPSTVGLYPNFSPIGNGSGLTNYSALNLTTNGFSPAPTAGQYFEWSGTGWEFGSPSGGSGLNQLTGDVTAGPGSGSQSATVVQVGGYSAANVASGATAANAATSANTASKIVARDSSGNFVAGTITAALSGNATTATTASGMAATGLTGTLQAGQFPALTGDITTTAGSLATTLKATGTAGTYTKTTFDSNGRETSGTTLGLGDLPSGVALTGSANTFTLGQTFNGGFTNTAATIYNAGTFTNGGVANLASLYVQGIHTNVGPILAQGNITNSVLTASTALVTDNGKALASSTTTATELGYVHGVTSAIQTQITAIAGAATSVTVNTANGLTNSSSLTGNVLTLNIGQTNLWQTTNNLVTAAVIDASIPESEYQTNASFTFGLPINTSAGKYNNPVLDVTNSSGSLITLTAPASWHAVGTWNCTNMSKIVLSMKPGFWTNASCTPIW